MFEGLKAWLDKPIGNRLEIEKSTMISTKAVVEILRSQAMTAQQFDLVDAFVVEMNRRNH